MTPGPGISRTSLPQGFFAGGINCGIRRYRLDLGLIISGEASVAAGVFTQNSLKAAPIKYCEKILPADDIKAIITNSGQANAATGNVGEENNYEMVAAVAKQLQCQPSQILAASTGVIGEALAIEKITAAIPSLVNNVTNIAEKFALAILTTDLAPKTIFKEVILSTGKVCVTGICKGSGMIHPNMATMLGYLLTDAKLSTHYAQQILKNVVDCSFNMISVDGDTSTNDCVFLLANGASQVSVITDEDQALFCTALTEVAIALAKSIARDGEGASKLIEIMVKGAPTLSAAKTAARMLTMSPLIKTAIYGLSPNWGRIMAKLGAAELPPTLLEQCTVTLQNTIVFKNNAQPYFDVQQLKNSMKQDTVHIVIDLNNGLYEASAWGCDLTERYIRINTGYIT